MPFFSLCLVSRERKYLENDEEGEESDDRFGRRLVVARRIGQVQRVPPVAALHPDARAQRASDAHDEQQQAAPENLGIHGTLKLAALRPGTSVVPHGLVIAAERERKKERK